VTSANSLCSAGLPVVDPERIGPTARAGDLRRSLRKDPGTSRIEAQPARLLFIDPADSSTFVENEDYNRIAVRNEKMGKIT
jgi:hypothetical protein